MLNNEQKADVDVGTHSKENLKYEQVAANEARQALVLWSQLDYLMESEMADGMVVREIRIQGPQATGNDWRAIIKGEAGGSKYVAFQNAESSRELISQIVRRVAEDRIKWRDDLPWERQIALKTE